MAFDRPRRRIAAGRTWRREVLILNRKVGESFVIPEFDIEVVVVEIKGDKVRIGIDAADEVDIFRREVWRAIQRDAGKRVTGEQPEGGERWL